MKRIFRCGVLCTKMQTCMSKERSVVPSFFEANFNDLNTGRNIVDVHLKNSNFSGC